MPPIKGRMISRMGRMGQQTGGEYAHLKLGITSKKKPNRHFKEAKQNSKISSEIRDEKLLKLRIPSSICRHLPSVKRFKGSKNYVDLTEDNNSIQSEDSELSWEEKPLSHHQILGVKRSTRGLVTSKYFVRPLTEERFTGMIWDIAFSPSGHVIVSCGEGILICDYDLQIKSKLDNIVLAGGVSFLSDGKIVAVCRNTDTVNVFTPTGEFLYSFGAGFSPMAIAATPDDRLIICDPGSKCVRIYNAEGKELKTIGPLGAGFKLRWPLYASMVTQESFLVSDCHSQTVLHFDLDGEFVGDMKLHTAAGSKVLRPHGVCVHENRDVFVIDMAVDSVEVFSEKDNFIQTLIPQEEGHHLRPKIVRVGGHNQNFLAVGGLVGIVKLYEFVSEEELKPKRTPVKTPVKTPTKKGRSSVVKRKIVKEEPMLIKEEIILDDEDEGEMIEKAEVNKDSKDAGVKEDTDSGMDLQNETEVPEVQRSLDSDFNSVHDPVLVEDSDDEDEDLEEDEDEDEEGEDEQAETFDEKNQRVDFTCVLENINDNASDLPQEETTSQEPVIVLDD